MSTTVNGTTGVTFPDGTNQNTSASGFGFKNRIINGACMIDQRNAGASVTVNADPVYTVDRWQGYKAGTINAFTVQQSTVAPAGFKNSVLITAGTGVTPVTTDYAGFAQKIEGLNVADFAWGTANAQTITIGFWVRSSLTGTFGFGVRNGAGNRSYMGSYTINSANTFEYKTVTIAGDTAGTWATDNTTGLTANFDIGVGPNFSTSAGSWEAANRFGLTGGVKLVATTGATLYITGVQLEKGSTATSFDYRPYGTELALCQRYFLRQSVSIGDIYQANGGNVPGATYVGFKVTMRSSPTVTFESTTSATLTSSQSAAYITADGFSYQVNITNTGTYNRVNVISAAIEL